MASWEYFIYSKSGRYSPEDIANVLMTKGYADGINCKSTLQQEIDKDHFMMLGQRFDENIKISQGQEGVMFSSGNGNEKDIKNIFNLFQKRDIEVKSVYKLSDIDNYKSYFEDAPLEVDGKTFSPELESKNGENVAPDKFEPISFSNVVFDNPERFEKSRQFFIINSRFYFYDATFDDVLFSDNVLIGQLEKCRFNRCTFENFNAESISFKDSVLTDCKITNSNFKDCDFRNTGLYHSQISKSDFTNANFAAASIRHTRFDNDNMSGVKFHGSMLDGVIITDATVNAPVEGLYAENITMGGATHQEMETSRNRIFSELKLFPFSIEQVVKQVKTDLEPLPNLSQQNIKRAVMAKPSQTEIDIVAKYEKLYNVPETQRVTHWFGDYGINVLYPNITEELFSKQLEVAFDELTEYWHTHDINQSLPGFLGVSSEEFEEMVRKDLPQDKSIKQNDNLSLSNNQIVDEHTQLQFEIVSKYNPAPNTYQTWIRKTDDIKSFEAALKDSDYAGWEQDGFDESYLASNAENALKTGKITVYSSHPIKQGVFVTPSSMEARSYSGDGKIYSKEVDIDSVAWIDPTQGQYANVEEYAVIRDSDLLYSATAQPLKTQEMQSAFVEHKLSEVREKISNPQPIEKSLTREEFDKLTSEISDIAKNYQADPQLAAEYFAFKAQFYQYSPNNALLIHLQNPHATFVASFTKWKDMGYSIKKGAKHIKISRPIEIAKFPRNVNGKTEMVDVKNANAEEKAKIANGEIEIKKVTKFVPHQVFDISQTTCPPEDYLKIFSRGYENIEQAQLYECIKEYAKDSGFSVVEEDMSSISLNGYYNREDDSIHINSTLQDSKELETMAHELAHGVLHKTSTQPTEIKEFEAESFGTMLKRKLGFPVSDESKRYIQSYFMQSKFVTKGQFNMDDTLNRLSKAFKHISTGIDNKIEEMGFGNPRENARTLQQAQANAIDPVKISSNFTQAL